MKAHNAAKVVDLDAIRTAALDRSYISMGNRRTLTVHEFYRYPARFSPAFVRAIVDGFSEPGDLVCDPFLGGGTTAVEAMLHGRAFVGSDINSLALFVSRAKTTIHHPKNIEKLDKWIRNLPGSINMRRSSASSIDSAPEGYLKHISTRETWRLRNAVGQALDSLADIRTPTTQLLARCSILRTAQWAFDMRKTLPTVSEFRNALAKNTKAMVAVAGKFTQAMDAVRSRHGQQNATLLQEGLPGLSSSAAIEMGPVPNLILTSPPYPGVYMLYHRWKVRGRKETPAPYWVAGALDGHGQAHYTMAARSDPTRDLYFKHLRTAYEDMTKIMDERTRLVQMVGFSSGDQLSRFNSVMSDVGLEEMTFESTSTAEDGRLWRGVPGRRWWVASDTNRDVAPSTAKEVVLFHRLQT